MTDATTGLPPQLAPLVDRAMKRRDEKMGELTTDDLAAIADELGLGDEARRQIPGAGWAAHNRGRAALERKAWDDAIEEASAGAGLLPGEAGPLELLAQAYQGRWVSNGLEWDRDQARRMAESALRIQPASAAAKTVLAHLSTGRRAPPSGRSVMLPMVAILGFLTAFGCVATVVAGFLVGSSSERSVVITEPVATHDERKPTRPRDRQLDVVVDGAEGLTFDIRRSELNNYDDVSWYKFAGVVRNGKQAEFEKVEFDVELLDGAGEVVTTAQASAPGTAYSGNEVRIGDAVDFDKLIRTDSRPRSVRLSGFVFKAEVPSDGNYPPSPKTTLRGEAPSKLEVRVRKVVDREKTFLVKEAGERFHTVVFEVENVGGAPVRMLKLDVVYTDGGGKEIHRDDFYAVTSSDPPMLPKDVRVVFHIETVPAAVRDWYVEIQSAQ